MEENVEEAMQTGKGRGGIKYLQTDMHYKKQKPSKTLSQVSPSTFCLGGAHAFMFCLE